MTGTPRLGVVLVNWRRADDTIECLESLLRSTIRLRVVVVDNGSGDGSAERIAAWAAGDVAPAAASPAMAALSTPPLAKPLRLRRLDAGAAASGVPDDADITLIDAGGNLGFAAGNNIGVAFLLRAAAIDYVWLLNNDTVVDADAASALLARMDSTHNIGMCGTIVRYYYRPDTIQALNGHKFSLWTGTSRGIATGLPANTPFDPARIARETDFVLGASLAVSRAFIVDDRADDRGLFPVFRRGRLGLSQRRALRDRLRPRRHRLSQGRRVDRLERRQGQAQRDVGLLPGAVAAGLHPAAGTAAAAVALAADAAASSAAACCGSSRKRPWS